MAKMLLLFTVFLLGQLTFSQDHAKVNQHFKKAVFANAQHETIPYRLLYPGNYNKSRSYPLVLFLHGAGAQGNDNESQLQEVPLVLLKAAAGTQNACFVLAPQCPKEDAWVWFPQYPLCSSAKEPSKACRLTLEIIDSLVNSRLIDPTRIYVTGLSLGGEGTFDIITRRPHFFAAAVPICGIADTAKVDLMKHTPLWIFHGELDEINPVGYSRNMVNALQKCGSKPIYTEYKGVNHDSWTNAYSEPDLIKWMFSHQLQQ